LLGQSPIGKRAPVLAKSKAFHSSRNTQNVSPMYKLDVRDISPGKKTIPQVPTLKQLRMINLQKQILEKTQAGIKAHIIDGFTQINRARSVTTRGSAGSA